MSAPERVACDLLVVGAGPSGLAAAVTVARHGYRVIVVERETKGGGVPRHCGHLGFGIREFGRLLSGPAYARRLVTMATGIDMRLGETVTGIEPNGLVEVSSPNGPYTIMARRIVLATGAREQPRSAKLIGGGRPFGIMTTGALQQCAYLHEMAPFQRPLIVGTELVSFSTLLTLRHIGARPAAFLETNSRITARRPGDLVARWIFGTPVLLETEIVKIAGVRRVEGVTIRQRGEDRFLVCDGVVFTGCFLPETALIRTSHIRMDGGTRGPVIDQHGRTSDPRVFACGNVLRPIETAGHSYREGKRVGTAVAASLDGQLPDRCRAVEVKIETPLKYAYPQLIALDETSPESVRIGLRLNQPVKGILEAVADGKPIARRRLNHIPERRLWLDLPVTGSFSGPVTLRLSEATDVSLTDRSCQRGYGRTSEINLTDQSSHSYSHLRLNEKRAQAPDRLAEIRRYSEQWDGR